MLKIGFVNPPHINTSLINIATWMFMKGYYSRVGKYKDSVEWLEPPYRYDEYQTVEDIYEEIKSADVVLFSSYIWNYHINDELAQLIKQRNPNVINVLGGPQIGDINERTYYDYFCKVTMPGELFIEDFIDSYFDNNGKPSVQDISFEYRSDKKRSWTYPNFSVYEDTEEFINKVKKYADDKKLRPYMIIETTRGCPYACTFCEWGGGTGTKIIKKDVDIVKRDILVLSKAGFKEVVCNDANFGVFMDRDLDILQFAKDNGIRIVDTNLVKSTNLKKRIELVDRLFDIVQPYASKAALVPNIGIQSVSDEAMRIAKRTDLTLEEKIALGKHIKKRCDEFGYRTFLELIRGMPGSTLEDFYQEWQIIYDLESYYGTWRYDYMALPDTESANPVQCEIYNIKLVDVYTDTIEEQDVEVGGLYKNRKSYFKTISSCHSYTLDDNAQMFFMNFAGNIFIRDFYHMVKDSVDVVNFTKLCWNISQDLPGFEEIYSEIKDILNSDTAPKNLRRINGVERITAISQFIEQNKFAIINELFTRKLQ